MHKIRQILGLCQDVVTHKQGAGGDVLLLAWLLLCAGTAAGTTVAACYFKLCDSIMYGK
jgi:hypothetical protein